MRCVSILKNIWLWTVVDRKNNELVGFEVGTRKTKYFENLSSKIEHIEAKKYASDWYKSYDIIDPDFVPFFLIASHSPISDYITERYKYNID